MSDMDLRILSNIYNQVTQLRLLPQSTDYKNLNIFYRLLIFFHENCELKKYGLIIHITASIGNKRTDFF